MTPLPSAPEGASRGARPFASAEDAWHWTMAALMARRDGTRPVLAAARVARPCQPDEVVRCLDRLYRQRRIDLGHVRVLRRWGERQTAPDPLRHSRDHPLWREAIRRLDWLLQQRGIVVPPTPAWMGSSGVDAGRRDIHSQPQWLRIPHAVTRAATTVCD